ncbi:MAG TPA: hypothetical protein VL405_03905 [Sphingomonas sp.]|jgi:hypothetical protein|nr:hypothetical protein [Sphingomonas sp.]
MTDPEFEPEFQRRRKSRAVVTAVLLVAMCLLFYFITLARIGHPGP